MPQVLECLPSKCEALNSNPTSAKRKKERLKWSILSYVYFIIIKKYINTAIMQQIQFKENSP
jgi:hypothetical protein